MAPQYLGDQTTTNIDAIEQIAPDFTLVCGPRGPARAADTSEVVWVSAQRWRGVVSHFNDDTTLDFLLFLLPGGAAIAVEVTGPHRAHLRRRRRAGAAPRGGQELRRSAADDAGRPAAHDEHDHLATGKCRSSGATRSVAVNNGSPRLRAPRVKEPQPRRRATATLTATPRPTTIPVPKEDRCTTGPCTG